MRIYTRVQIYGAEKAENTLKDIKDRTDNFRPVLRWAQRKLERDFSENFNTFGSLSAKAMLKGGWPPLDLSYGAWKATRYPGAPIMVQTGETLFRVTHPDVDMSDNKVTISVPGKIAKFHQFGTTNMPARPLLFVPRDFDREFGKKLVQYVIKGKKAGVA